MKKLLILVLVFGLTSMASADLVFTINDGEPQPDEITMCPSDDLELDLHLDGGTIVGYQLTYSLSNEQAEFVLPAPDSPPQYGVVFPWQSMFAGKVNGYDGDGVMSWVEITANNFMAANGPLDLMENLWIHCLEPTDVVLEIRVSGATVIDGETIPNGTLLHTLTIHQIPEPATMLLLGLGGLFLRRRK